MTKIINKNKQNTKTPCIQKTRFVTTSLMDELMPGQRSAQWGEQMFSLSWSRKPLIDWWQTLIRQMKDFYCVWLHRNLSTQSFSPRLSSLLAGQMILKWGVSGPDVYLSCLPEFVLVFALAGIFLRSCFEAGDKAVLQLGSFRGWDQDRRRVELPGAHVPQANRPDKIRVSGAQLEAFLSWPPSSPLSHSSPALHCLRDLPLKHLHQALTRRLQSSCRTTVEFIFFKPRRRVWTSCSSFFVPFRLWFLFLFFLLPSPPSSISSHCTSQQGLSKVGSAVSM